MPTHPPSITALRIRSLTGIRRSYFLTETYLRYDKKGYWSKTSATPGIKGVDAYERYHITSADPHPAGISNRLCTEQDQSGS